MRHLVVWLAAVLALALCATAASGQREREDSALSVAREIARRVRSFPNLRARAPLGVWSERPERRFSVRTTHACHASLREAGIAFTEVRTTLTPIPAPVRIDGPIEGVTLVKLREDAPLIVACELAARLPAIARVLGAHHVTRAHVLSSWRREPRTSFHTMGLALDLARFDREDGSSLVVERDWRARPERETCEAVDEGDSLRALLCELAEGAPLSTAIGPEYSPGHRDHLHIDVRPDDARAFVR